jgi:lysozyme family protein
MTFDDAFDKLIANEGGYQDNPNDRGNWTSGVIGVGELKGTKYGLSAMSYPMLDIKSLTLEQAREIYRRDYWERFNALNISDELRFVLFDAAVNHGPGNAVRMLQRAVLVIDDGHIGPVTLIAASKVSPCSFLLRFAAERLRFMSKLRAWDRFGRGWVSRVAENLATAGSA